MKSLQKMSELANRFEHKLYRKAQEAPTPLDAPVVSQSGTTELFFDDESKQRAFATAIQDPSGAVYKALLAAFNKGGGNVTASFDLKVNAEAQKGASWVLDVQPPALKATISAALDGVYQKVVGGTMAARQKAADTKAKAGSGSGTLNVGALELAP